jgi:fused signal recognition particle receptor
MAEGCSRNGIIAAMKETPHWRQALERTRRTVFGRLITLLGAGDLNNQTLEELESLLLQADMGPSLAAETLAYLRGRIRAEGLTRPEEARRSLREFLAAQLGDSLPIHWEGKPSVVLIVGVNGSGKTTTIAKLAQRYAGEGKRVMLAAADTFRAAATEQLDTWAHRLHVEIIAGAPDADPGAVAHDAAQAALHRGADLLLVDTAGRLHTRFNLMEELKKVHRVLGKVIPGAPHHTWLVLDASTGQNALAQAAAFREAVRTDGVILTKLDGTSKGGMVFRIRAELGLPVLFVGLGEGAEDLAPFDREAFLDGLLE